MKTLDGVLFVCMGNICRSPMAEGILRNRLKQSGREDGLLIDSAGTGGWHAGAPPDPRAIRVCEEHGIDISRQRARILCSDDYTRFDLILCADRHTLSIARSRRPDGTSAEIALLLEWADPSADAVLPAIDVPDPYNGDAEGFSQVYRLLNSAAVGLLTRLQLPA